MAVEWAKKTRDPITVENQPLDTPILMTPQGISSLFSNIVRPSILGERMVRKESFWSEKMNQQVLDSHLTLLDNRRMEGGFSSSSRDGEGVPTSCHTIVDNGVLRKMIWSTRDAAKNVGEGRITEAETTGSASRGSHMSPPTTGCGDVQLLSSNKPQSRQELIETMDKGYIVHSVMGAHTANPTSGDFSVTTSTILRVEDGEILGALKQAGVSGNLFRAISNGVHLGHQSNVNGVSNTGSNHLSDILFTQGMRINPA
jgi:PmbA protein